MRDGPAVAGIRPQDLVMAQHGLPATVVLAEATGQETLLTLHAGEHELILRTDPHCTLARGTAVSVQPGPAAVHFFDAASGDRL